MSVDLSGFARDISAPARGGFAVTKSDVTVFDNIGTNQPPARSIYVGTTGDLNVKFVDDTVVLFKAVPGGSLLPIHVKQVLSTGTTAADILGIY